jgi:hypothetical protein
MKPNKENGVTMGGWSSATDAKIRELLGLSEQLFLRGDHDLDLFDACRFHWDHPGIPIRDDPANREGWREAVMLVLAEWRKQEDEIAAE